MIPASVAARAYAAVQDSAGLGKGEGTSATGPAASFGDMLQKAVADTVSSSHNAEKQMQAQVQGKADLVDVATAVSSAEASLETVMAVRDQVISAYQEIMRMTI